MRGLTAGSQIPDEELKSGKELAVGEAAVVDWQVSAY